jgi:hypothetical protein
LSNLKSLLNTAEFNLINRHFDAANRRHPAWSIVNAHDLSVDYKRELKDYLTNQAIDLIQGEKTGDQWLKNAKKRIAQTSDFEECASAMAETRCYGAFLECGFVVQPVPTSKLPTPDFEIELGGERGVVEVATKLEHDEQTKRAEQIAAGGTPPGVERSSFHLKNTRIDTKVSVVHPFGAPDPDKEGDTTQTNAISRICSVKQKESQVIEGQFAILWLDFRDLSGWPSVLELDEACPLNVGNAGILHSGACWYAFYGWKGAPVLETNYSPSQVRTPMAHFGRFHPSAPKTSRYSAVVLCLAEGTVMFENSMAPTPFSGGVRGALTKLPHFSLSRSIADWQQGDVDRANVLSRSMIEALCQHRGL